MARGKRAAVAKAVPPMKPAGKRKRAETKVLEEPAAKRAPASKRPPRARKQAAEALPLVTHPSHGQAPYDLFMHGDGSCGQLGLGEDVAEKLRPFPLQIDGMKVRQVATGGMHTVAVLDNGTVYSWGVNDEGALGRQTEGPLWTKAEGLREEGGDGDSYVPGKVSLPAGAGRIIQVSAGDSHTAALTEHGALYGWGTFRDGSGVMGFSDAERIQLVPVSVYQPTSADAQVVKVVSGADHCVALTRAGGVLSWGSGQQGQLGRVGNRLSDRARLATQLAPHPVPFKRRRGVGARLADVYAGTYTSFARTTDGHVFVWGLNNYGQLGLPLATPAVFSPTPVPSLRHATVAAGQHHTLAVTQEGSLLSFGRPTYGRLGRSKADVNSDEGLPEPTAVDGLEESTIVSAAAGLAVSGAVNAEGRAYLWGFNENSQLAKGDDDGDEVLPRKLAETKRLAGQRVVTLAFGGQHAALLTAHDAGDGAPAARRAADREEDRAAAVAEPAAAEETADAEAADADVGDEDNQDEDGAVAEADPGDEDDQDEDEAMADGEPDDEDVPEDNAAEA